jgi:hypothetical protein
MSQTAELKTVHINQRKWPDSPHWHFDARWLGEDDYGTWVFVSADTVVQRGDEPPRLSGFGFLGLIPPDDPWIVEFYRDHDQLVVYINIGTIPTWNGHEVTQVDLDLDVILTPQGSVEVIDQDEFAENQIALAYPLDIIRSAENAARMASELLRTRTEPFGEAFHRSWNSHEE